MQYTYNNLRYSPMPSIFSTRRPSVQKTTKKELNEANRQLERDFNRKKCES